jgi:hypothetical protein
MADEKKIIVDEDWKSQVAAEKAAFEQAQHEPDAQAGDAAADEPAAGGGRRREPAMPPASFEMLITMFATEAMVGLGQLPHPETNQAELDLRHAKYAIDMLEMIAEKTKGNLTPDEEQGLGALLHQLRMAYVAVKQAAGQQRAPAGDDG